jgi:gluconolactonase
MKRGISSSATPGWAWVLNERAEPVEILRRMAGASMTNVAFAGPERKTA